MVFYKNVKFPFIDPYDGKMIENVKQFRCKSFSKLNHFNEIKKCLFCKTNYTFNIFNIFLGLCKACLYWLVGFFGVCFIPFGECFIRIW